MTRFYLVILALVLAALLFLFLSIGADSHFSGAKVFRIPLDTNPPSLDPAILEDVGSDGVARKIFNGLIRFDQAMKPIADLAETVPEWNAADNSYTFKLRKGVLFQNGREVKASDVKYSWERLLDPAVSQRTQILEPVVGAKEKIDRKTQETSGIQVLDDYTVKVSLVKASPTFMLEIGMVNASIIPREAVEAAENDQSSFSHRPVGTGPFKLVEWRENISIKLERFAGHFKGCPKIERLEYEIIPEPQMRLELFTRGYFHVCDIPVGHFTDLKKERPECISKNLTFRINYLGITMNKGEIGKATPTSPLGTNPKLRQAINHALNREYISDNLLESRAQPALSVLPPGMMAHDPNLKGWTYDPEKAKALLAEAGFPGGKGLPALTLLHRNNADAKKQALAIHRDLESIGLKVELQSLDWALFLDRLANNPPDMFLSGWVADYNDPDNFLYYLFHTRQWGRAGNQTRYSEAEVDTLIEKGRETLVPSEREHFYHLAEEKIVADCPWVLLVNQINYILLQPEVTGVREQLCNLDVGAGLSQVDFSKVDLKKP